MLFISKNGKNDFYIKIEPSQQLIKFFLQFKNFFPKERLKNFVNNRNGFFNAFLTHFNALLTRFNAFLTRFNAFLTRFNASKMLQQRIEIASKNVPVKSTQRIQEQHIRFLGIPDSYLGHLAIMLNLQKQVTVPIPTMPFNTIRSVHKKQ